MKIKQLSLAILITATLHSAIRAQSDGTKSFGKNSLSMDSILKQGPEYDLIKPMTGEWKVIQTIYKMGGTGILSRDTFNVERKMVGNFLQEMMQPGTQGGKNSFTRISYLNYNRTNARWEYIVLDSRFPLMMFETSNSSKLEGDSITLNLDAFTTPPFWGDNFAGLLGRERRVIKFNQNTTLNDQYWTLPAIPEFHAIRYEYLKK